MKYHDALMLRPHRVSSRSVNRRSHETEFGRSGSWSEQLAFPPLGVCAPSSAPTSNALLPSTGMAFQHSAFGFFRIADVTVYPPRRIGRGGPYGPDYARRGRGRSAHDSTTSCFCSLPFSWWIEIMEWQPHEQHAPRHGSDGAEQHVMQDASPRSGRHRLKSPSDFPCLRSNVSKPR